MIHAKPNIATSFLALLCRYRGIEITARFKPDGVHLLTQVTISGVRWVIRANTAGATEAQIVKRIGGLIADKVAQTALTNGDIGDA